MSRIGVGKKAWETRRKNEAIKAIKQKEEQRKKRYVEAGKLSWVTRRINATIRENEIKKIEKRKEKELKKQLRSDAIKRGWVTRKENKRIQKIQEEIASLENSYDSAKTVGIRIALGRKINILRGKI